MLLTRKQLKQANRELTQQNNHLKLQIRCLKHEIRDLQARLVANRIETINANRENRQLTEELNQLKKHAREAMQLLDRYQNLLAEEWAEEEREMWANTNKDFLSLPAAGVLL